MADGIIPHEAIQAAAEQAAQMPQKPLESLDQLISEGRIDRLQETVAAEAQAAQKEAGELAQAAVTEGDPDALGANQEIAQVSQETQQQLQAAQSEALQEISLASQPAANDVVEIATAPVSEQPVANDVVKDVAISEPVGVAAALEGESVKTVSVETSAEAPLTIEQQHKKLEALADGAKQRMRELHEALMKMRESGGELDAEEMATYEKMLDTDSVLNNFVEQLQQEFRNEKNEGSIRARAAELAGNFALGARAQHEYAQSLMNPKKVAEAPAQKTKAKERTEKPANTSEKKESALTQLQLEKRSFQRLQQMDALVEQLSNDGLDSQAQIGLRQRLEELQQEAVRDFDQLSQMEGNKLAALLESHQRMNEVIDLVDASLAENDPAARQLHLDRIQGLRQENAQDAPGMEAFFAEQEADDSSSQERIVQETMKVQAERRAQFSELTGQVDQLVEAFKANGLKAGSDEIRQLRKLMMKTHPDKNPNDVATEKLYKVLSSLKMAFEGDANAWKNPRGTSLEADYAELKREMGLEGDEAEGSAAASAKVEEKPLEPGIPQPESRPNEGPNEVIDEGLEAEQRLKVMEELMSEKIRKVESAFDEVLEEGDADKIEMSAGLLKKLYAERMGDLTKEINAYYKKPSSERTLKSQKKIQILEYEEELLGAQMDGHQKKRELSDLKREKVVVDQDVEALQRRLEGLKVVDSGLVLGAKPSTGPDLAVAGASASAEVVAGSAELQALLQTALGKQAELAAKIGVSAAALAGIYEGISRIMKARSKALEEMKELKEEKKSKLEMVSKVATESDLSGNHDVRIKDAEGPREGGGGGGGGHEQSWFVQAGDMIAMAMHGDEASIDKAKQLFNRAIGNKKAA